MLGYALTAIGLAVGYLARKPIGRFVDWLSGEDSEETSNYSPPNYDVGATVGQGAMAGAARAAAIHLGYSPDGPWTQEQLASMVALLQSSKIAAPLVTETPAQNAAQPIWVGEPNPSTPMLPNTTWLGDPEPCCEKCAAGGTSCASHST